ncbi:sortase domain-containing protein [Nocardioides sp. GXQ0305]|uniref:sortase domain-containing protein n=1 Tax=Nocardioides sp. GXQ0305 TaxID=3423912 RepID=UPI003D7E7EC0
MARAWFAALAAFVLLAPACAAERGERRADRGPTGPETRAVEPRVVEPGAVVEAEPSGPEPSDGRPARAVVSIPALDLRGLTVVPYRGRTDDARGTLIQNGGDAASPHGPRGGTGPGGIGNYQVTGHRLSSTMPFRHLPGLQRGDEVRVNVGETRYVYSIVGTRWTSFRSPRSLAEQRAAVPGRPGVEPRRAMITLSTCATIEDHAAGNFWADEFDNPEHRIDKIGVLERVTALDRG